MWNDNKSIILSRLCVCAFIILLAVVAVSSPWLVDYLILHSLTAQSTSKTYFLITVYTGSVPAAVLLFSLLFLLNRIGDGRVFIAKNVTSLRHISWCCFVGAAVCAVSAAYYFPWALVGLAAAFMGLIVRVIKNVFARAVALQDDADYTI